MKTYQQLKDEGYFDNKPEPTYGSSVVVGRERPTAVDETEYQMINSPPTVYVEPTTLTPKETPLGQYQGIPAGAYQSAPQGVFVSPKYEGIPAGTFAVAPEATGSIVRDRFGNPVRSGNGGVINLPTQNPNYKAPNAGGKGSDATVGSAVKQIGGK